MLGSGSTLLAARYLNVKSIGIEVDEHYATVAANHLSNIMLFLVLQEYGNYGEYVLLLFSLLFSPILAGPYVCRSIVESARSLPFPVTPFSFCQITLISHGDIRSQVGLPQSRQIILPCSRLSIYSFYIVRPVSRCSRFAFSLSALN